MNEQQTEAIATILVLAAFADGRKDDAEREQIRVMLADLGDVNAGAIFQKVLLKKTSVADEALKLDDPAHRQLAYELAVCVCDADGVVIDEERAFLNTLAKALKLESARTQQIDHEREEVARELMGDADEPTIDLEQAKPIPLEASANTGGTGTGTGTAVAGTAIATQTEPGAPLADDSVATAERAAVDKKVDSMVLKYAILNAALELLPQNLATLAIIPLQTKMVYRVGRDYGVKLDRGHIKEFIGVIGVGMTGQVVESFARDLFGKLAKKAMGKMGKTVVKTMTSATMTFATTYALGQVAKQYYAGGRKLSAVNLKALFQTEVSRGKALFDQHRPAVEQTSRGINPGEVMNLVRSGGPA